MENANGELAHVLLDRALAPNVMQARIKVKNLKTRNGRWLN